MKPLTDLEREHSNNARIAFYVSDKRNDPNAPNKCPVCHKKFMVDGVDLSGTGILCDCWKVKVEQKNGILDFVDHVHGTSSSTILWYCSTCKQEVPQDGIHICGGVTHISNVPTGWQCPVCKTVYAPHISKCKLNH